MTQQTFNDNVLIDGSQDVEQLRVQGHTTQTEPLETWEDSAGHVLAQVMGDGRLIVGDNDGTPNSLIEAHQLEASLTKPNRGFHSTGQVSEALDTLHQWIVGELELTGSDAVKALQTALRIRAANLNTGTPDEGAELRGADIEVINNGSADPLLKVTGLQVGVTNASGKTIADAIGLKVKLDNSGTITNLYAIYTEGEGPVHLDDYLELKNLETAPATPPSGFLLVYPKTDGKLYAKNSDGTEFDLTGGSGAVSSVNSQTGDVVLDTDDVAEGSTNLYYTDTRFDTALASKDTDDVAEGSTNLYYTNTRADARISAQKGAANGLATLGADSKVPANQLPAIAVTDVFVVSSEAAMLALTAERGDVAVRTDLNKSFILTNETPSTLSNWQEILAPDLGAVSSVNGQTGTVVLDSDDVAEGPTNLYYTNERVDDRVATLLTAGSNVDLTYNDGANILTISVTGLASTDVADFSEAVDDRLAALLQPGTGINLSYNDSSNTLTISVSGLTSSNISDFTEAAQDAVAAMMTAGANIALTYNDAANTFTIAITGQIPAANGGLGADASVFNGLIKMASGVASVATSDVDYLTPLSHVFRVVRVSTDSHVNISSPPTSMDNVTLSSGDRILLTNQITASQNGIWQYNGSGNALTRPSDYPSGSTVFAYYGLVVKILEGSTVPVELTQNGMMYYLNTTGTITIDTTNTTWSHLQTNVNSGYVKGILNPSNGGLGIGVGSLNHGVPVAESGSFSLLSQLSLLRGGTGSDLSSTGPGFLKQTGSGSNVSVAALANADIPSTMSGKTFTGIMINTSISGSAISDDGTLASPSSVNVPTTNALDIALKLINIKKAVDYATAAALPANTYSNGTSGLGATLTANANGALSVDGASPAVNDRILVKDEATATNNGVYIVTQAGDASHPYILTRATDSDSSTEIFNTILRIRFGTANGGRIFYNSNSTAPILGTNNITYTIDIASQSKANAFSGSNTFSGLLVLPGSTDSTTAGSVAYDTTDNAFKAWDGSRDRWLTNRGWQPYAAQLGFSNALAFGAANSLAANGGTLLIPIHLYGHMLLRSVALWNTDTTGARSWHWALYQDRNNTANAIAKICESNGSDAFTASAASLRAIAVANIPQYLGPGSYFLAIQNNHASNTFSIAAQAAGIATGLTMSKSKTISTTFGSTLDIVAATWAVIQAIDYVILKGAVAGDSVGY